MKNKNSIDKQKIQDEETKVIVLMPNEIEIELVQANELRHYELFQWLVVLLLPVAVGFWTAYFTGDGKPELLWSASVFTIISGLFIFSAYKYRKKVFHGTIKKIASLNSFKRKKNIKKSNKVNYK